MHAVEAIADLTAKHYGFTLAQLKEAGRHNRGVTEARRVAMALSVEILAPIGREDVAKRFGRRPDKVLEASRIIHAAEVRGERRLCRLLARIRRQGRRLPEVMAFMGSPLSVVRARKEAIRRARRRRGEFVNAVDPDFDDVPACEEIARCD